MGFKQPAVSRSEPSQGQIFGAVRSTALRRATAALAAVVCGALISGRPALAADAGLTTLYSFQGISATSKDGYYPAAGMIKGTDGNFYGTTEFGGVSGEGTVFRLTPAGVVTTLYSFPQQAEGPDGEAPVSSLVQGTDGNFYGTTLGGGTANDGTLFKITPGGVLTTLYSFKGGSDGAQPRGSLVQGPDGDFYGTTSAGGGAGAGPYFDGTVFKISPIGELTILHSFGGGSDGAGPGSGLVLGSDGSFYGTTFSGGQTNSVGGGTVFKVTADGVLTTLYAFSGLDGLHPGSALMKANDGNFYGTTEYGGASYVSASSYGVGSLFRLTPAGILASLYSFSGKDGAVPHAALIQGEDGNLYGTTYAGGSGTRGAGTLFEITTGGVFTSLYSFPDTWLWHGPHAEGKLAIAPDGGYPTSSLVSGGDGVFYGTTSTLGKGDKGTVFMLSVPGAP